MMDLLGTKQKHFIKQMNEENQGSDNTNWLMKDLITLVDLEMGICLGEEWSIVGSKQQLKSPPETS